jgi:hypothetical protein
VSPARSGLCTFLSVLLSARRLATVEPWERFGKADQHVLTCVPTFAIPYTKPIKRRWSLQETSPYDTKHYCSHRGQDTRNEEACSLARLKRPPSRLPIVRRYGYVHRLPYPAAIMEIIARLFGTPVESSTISASRKACSSSTFCRRSTIAHVKEDKHHHCHYFVTENDALLTLFRRIRKLQLPHSAQPARAQLENAIYAISQRSHPCPLTPHASSVRNSTLGGFVPASRAVDNNLPISRLSYNIHLISLNNRV